MHNEIKYEGPNKADKAIEDVREWLGADRFNLLSEYIESLSDTPQNRDKVALMISFAGVQGYPVTAMCDKYMGQHPIELS